MSTKAFNVYPKRTSSPELNETIEKQKFLVLGTCQLAAIAGALEERGHQVDYQIWENQPWTMPPTIDAISTYDCVIATFTLRQIFSNAVNLMYNVDNYNMYELEPIWPKIISDGYEEDILFYCKKTINKFFEHLSGILSANIPFFLMSFLEPRRNPQGNLFPNYSGENIKYFIHTLNIHLENKIRSRGGYLFEINEIFNEYGKIYQLDDYLLPIVHASFIHDFGSDIDNNQNRIKPSTEMKKLYDTNETLSLFTHQIASRIENNLIILHSPMQIKLIIVDLDDTLWRGISGEKDELGFHELDGWPAGLAEALLFFKQRGGLLAICSKNDEEITKRKFTNLFRNGLVLEDFCSIKINFNSKAENISEILSEANILPKNTLFIDDNPHEISAVLSMFPDMHILSEEHYDWRRQILYSPLTQGFSVSTESEQRTELVKAKIQREQAQKTMDRESWLTSLDLRHSYSTVARIEDGGFSRAFELINKTNQFNTTGRRWTLEEMQEFFLNGGELLCTELTDNIVSNGMISVILYQRNRILQMVLSCRVFGMESEYSSLHFLTNKLLANHEIIEAEFQDTGKNFTCHTFFPKAGFHLDEEDRLYKSSSTTYEPKHIRVESAK